MRICLELVLRTLVAAALAAIGLQAEAALQEPHKLATTVVPPRVVSVVRSDTRTGRLVRSIVVAPKPVPSRVVAEQSASADDETVVKPDGNPVVRTMVEEAAKNLDVNPLLVHSVIQVESNYNPYAVSPKGARGLMQLMPATARRFGVKDSFDARQNIEGGVKYLKFLQDTFKDDRLAIAAYNAGEGAVTKYGNVPPYPETMNYVAKVGKKYGQAKRSAEKSAAAASAKKVEKPTPAPTPAEEEPRHIMGYVDQEGRLHIANR